MSLERKLIAELQRLVQQSAVIPGFFNGKNFKRDDNGGVVENRELIVTATQPGAAFIVWFAAESKWLVVSTASNLVTRETTLNERRFKRVTRVSEQGSIVRLIITYKAGVFYNVVCQGSKCSVVGTALGNLVQFNVNASLLYTAYPNVLNKLNQFLFRNYAAVIGGLTAIEINPYQQAFLYNKTTELQTYANNAVPLPVEENDTWSLRFAVFYLGKGYFSSTFTITAVDVAYFIFATPTAIVEYRKELIPASMQSRSQYNAELQAISPLYVIAFAVPSYQLFRNYNIEFPLPRINNASNTIVTSGTHTFTIASIGMTQFVSRVDHVEHFVTEADVFATNEGVITQKLDLTRTTQYNYVSFDNLTSTNITYTENLNQLVYTKDTGAIITLDTSDVFFVYSNNITIPGNTVRQAPYVVNTTDFNNGSYKYRILVEQALSLFRDFDIDDLLNLEVYNYVTSGSGTGIVKGVITAITLATVSDYYYAYDLTIQIESFKNGITSSSFSLISANGNPLAFILTRANSYYSNKMFRFTIVAPSVSSTFSDVNLFFVFFGIYFFELTIANGYFAGSLSQDVWKNNKIYRLANASTFAYEDSVVLETWELVNNKIYYRSSKKIKVPKCVTSLLALDVGQVLALGNSFAP